MAFPMSLSCSQPEKVSPLDVVAVSAVRKVDYDFHEENNTSGLEFCHLKFREQHFKLLLVWSEFSGCLEERVCTCLKDHTVAASFKLHIYSARSNRSSRIITEVG